MKKISFSIVVLSIFLLIIGNLGAQESKPIYFKSGQYFPQYGIELSESKPYQNHELVGDKYYRLIQFKQIPTESQKNTLKNAGITLLEYVPDFSFFVSISQNANLTALTVNGGISFEPISSKYKLTEDLFYENYPEWSLISDEKIQINGIYFSDITKQEAENALIEKGAEIIKSNNVNIIHFIVDISNLNDIYLLPHFYYFEQADQPGEPENFRGRTNHRSNTLATNYSGGLKYDGTGMTVMLQDDGIIGPHIDYQGRIDLRTSTNSGNHGDHTAGTIMGAGNVNPRGMGAAFGAFLLVYGSSNNNYDDVPTLYTDEDVYITSKSYSNGCNGGYTSLARQLDQQTRQFPSLIHVFSSGNDGASDCDYGAGSGWGNITGGHKSGKNVVAVGNLSYTDALASSSSRGPATDGRIKPDVCAVGTSVFSTMDPHTYQTISGTSMACPGVAGVFTQLYHAYKDLNGGAIPNSALIKATVLNTADDLGNIGPDYKFGWGRINARRAYDVISNGNYISGSVSQGDINNHVINIPANTSQVRIMVYWTDYEGASNATKALVNDINIQVIDPTTSIFNPWVLDPTPDPALLDNPAVRGNDTLNNVEQVTIDNPIAGNYTITIDGFAIPQGPQEYYIVYEFLTDEITVTYPIGGEGFSPGSTETIRWDAYSNTSNFSIEYSTDNGTAWLPINLNYSASRRYYTWNVPSELSGLTKVRVTRGAQSDESDEVFSIIGTPTNLNVDWACPDSLKLSWDVITGATTYEIYKLGAMYMEPIGTSSINSAVLFLPATDTMWFSVKALGPDNAVSERAVAIQKLPGTFSCTIPIDASIASTTPSNDAVVLSCITPTVDVVADILNDGLDPLTDIPVSYQLNGGSIVTENYPGPLNPGEIYTHTFATPIVPVSGNNSLLVWSEKTGDENELNDTLISNFIFNDTPPRTLPWSLDLESFSLCSTASNCEEGTCMLTDDLINIPNTDDDIDWRANSGSTPSSGTGPSQDFNPGNASGKYLYLETSASPVCSNKTALLMTPCIDLSGTTSPSFVFAYHMYGANMGSLAVDVFVNDAWTNDIVTPISGDQGDNWFIQVVSLNAYIGEIINLRIRGTTGSNYASDMAVDDIRVVDGFVGIEEQTLSNISIYPNPFKDEIIIEGLKEGYASKAYVYNVLGELLFTKNITSKSLSIDASDMTSGIYLIKIETEDSIFSKKIFKH